MSQVIGPSGGSCFVVDGLVRDAVSGTVIVCAVSVPDPEGDRSAGFWEIRTAVASVLNRTDRGYVVWFDGTTDGAFTDDVDPATNPSYSVSPMFNPASPVPNFDAPARSAALHEFMHLMGGTHTLEYGDHMVEIKTGQTGIPLCGPGSTNAVTVDCGKNDFYSSYCALQGCALTGVNTAKSPFLRAPVSKVEAVTCRGTIAIYGDEISNSWTGGSAADVYQAWEGNDTAMGAGAADTLCGHWGNDALSGGVGTDTLHGDFGADTLRGNDGNDTVYGNEGVDNIYDGNGTDVVDGGAGQDTLYPCADGIVESSVGIEVTMPESSAYC